MNEHSVNIMKAILHQEPIIVPSLNKHCTHLFRSVLTTLLFMLIVTQALAHSPALSSPVGLHFNYCYKTPSGKTPIYLRISGKEALTTERMDVLIRGKAGDAVELYSSRPPTEASGASDPVSYVSSGQLWMTHFEMQEDEMLLRDVHLNDYQALFSSAPPNINTRAHRLSSSYTPLATHPPANGAVTWHPAITKTPSYEAPLMDTNHTTVILMPTPRSRCPQGSTVCTGGGGSDGEDEDDPKKRRPGGRPPQDAPFSVVLEEAASNLRIEEAWTLPFHKGLEAASHNQDGFRTLIVTVLGADNRPVAYIPIQRSELLDLTDELSSLYRLIGWVVDRLYGSPEGRERLLELLLQIQARYSEPLLAATVDPELMSALKEIVQGLIEKADSDFSLQINLDELLSVAMKPSERAISPTPVVASSESVAGILQAADDPKDTPVAPPRGQGKKNGAAKPGASKPGTDSAKSPKLLQAPFDPGWHKRKEEEAERSLELSTLYSVLHNTLLHHSNSDAFVYQDSSRRAVSYTVFFNAVQKYRNSFRAFGLRAGDRIAFIAHNTLEVAAMIFAANAEELIYVPVSPGLSPETWQQMIHSVAPRLVITFNDEMARRLLQAPGQTAGTDEEGATGGSPVPYKTVVINRAEGALPGSYPEGVTTLEQFTEDYRLKIGTLISTHPQNPTSSATAAIFFTSGTHGDFTPIPATNAELIAEMKALEEEHENLGLKAGARSLTMLPWSSPGAHGIGLVAAIHQAQAMVIVSPDFDLDDLVKAMPKMGLNVLHLSGRQQRQLYDAYHARKERVKRGKLKVMMVTDNDAEADVIEYFGKSSVSTYEYYSTARQGILFSRQNKAGQGVSSKRPWSPLSSITVVSAASSDGTRSYSIKGEQIRAGSWNTGTHTVVAVESAAVTVRHVDKLVGKHHSYSIDPGSEDAYEGHTVSRRGGAGPQKTIHPQRLEHQLAELPFVRHAYLTPQANGHSHLVLNVDPAILEEHLIQQNDGLPDNTESNPRVWLSTESVRNALWSTVNQQMASSITVAAASVDTIDLDFSEWTGGVQLTPDERVRRHIVRSTITTGETGQGKARVRLTRPGADASSGYVDGGANSPSGASAPTPRSRSVTAPGSMSSRPPQRPAYTPARSTPPQRPAYAPARSTPPPRPQPPQPQPPRQQPAANGEQTQP